VRDFGWALRRLRKGEALRRQHWPEHESIAIVSGDQCPAPYIEKRWIGGAASQSAWRPSQDDLLATDWQLKPQLELIADTKSA